MSLNKLRDEALRIAVEHGFKDASVPEDFALMHSEISEALEDYREGKLPHEMTYVFRRGMNVIPMSGLHDGGEINKPCGIPSEMADVVIRVLHFCGKHGIDIEKAVAEKMAYNESRPFKHGKII